MGWRERERERERGLTSLLVREAIVHLSINTRMLGVTSARCDGFGAKGKKKNFFYVETKHVF